LPQELTKERAIFELYLAALMGKAKLRQQELAADSAYSDTPQKASHIWRALILAKATFFPFSLPPISLCLLALTSLLFMLCPLPPQIPKWMELLLLKDLNGSVGAGDVKSSSDAVSYERIIVSLSQFTALVGLCSYHGDIIDEIAKTWVVRQFTTLEVMRKVLNKPTMEVVFFSRNDASTVPEDALLQMIMKKEGNMMTFSDTQFKSIMESMVRAALSHAEMIKHISLQISEVYVHFKQSRKERREEGRKKRREERKG